MNPFVPYLVLQRGLFEIAVQNRIGNAITRLVPFRMLFHRPSGILIPPGSARGLPPRISKVHLECRCDPLISHHGRFPAALLPNKAHHL